MPDPEVTDIQQDVTPEDVTADPSTANEDAQEDPSTSTPDTEAAHDEPEKGKSKIERRFSDMARARREAEERAERAEREAERYRRIAEERERQTGQAESDHAPVSERPKEEDFETYEAYRDALDDWRIDKKAAEKVAAAFEERERAERAERERQEAHAREKTARERFQTGYERYGDAFDIVSSVEVHNDAVLDEIVVSEHYPDLAFYLANNEAELRKIEQLGGRDLTRAIARLELKIESTLAPGDRPAKTPQKPNVPTQPTRNAGGMGAPVRPLDDSAPMSVFDRELSKRLGYR